MTSDIFKHQSSPPPTTIPSQQPLPAQPSPARPGSDVGRPGAPAVPPPFGSSRTRLSSAALPQPRDCKNTLSSSGIKERAPLRETSRRERTMGGPHKLPLNKGGEKMLQRDLDLPTSACCSSTGGRPSLGTARPRHQQLPAPSLHPLLAPMVSPPHLLL